MIAVRWRRVLALVLTLVVVGCAPSLPRDPLPAVPPETLDLCCARTETSPRFFVALIDRYAETVQPWLRRVELRRPWLSGHPEALRKVLDLAEPLDVLTVSMKFHLGGRMSNGVMTHALIYVGSEAELRRIGLWSHPALRPWQDAIRSGARFVEAIDPAVRFAAPNVALRVDSVAIYRPRLAPTARARALGVLMGQIGAGFNPHFRLDGDDCLFCTELVARAMPVLGLKVREVYGRPTILPDDLAAMALRGDGGLRFVAYLRGRRDGWDLLGPEALTADLAAAWAGLRKP
jgi:hypothetical protein